MILVNTPVNPNQALWEKGDFTRLAETMRGSGEALVRQLGIRPGMRILDLGCGDGTTALPAAQLGAEVLGVDIASNLVAAGSRRARELGVTNCRFEEGDAVHLAGLEDRSFDLVVSIFGAMFAPRPQEAAREMVRVTKAGGRIVMGNWIPGDPTLVAQILKISSACTPPPPEGFVSPMTWSCRKYLRAVLRNTPAFIALMMVLPWLRSKTSPVSWVLLTTTRSSTRRPGPRQPARRITPENHPIRGQL